MHEEKVKGIMAQVKSFPGMPTTAMRIMRLLQHPETTAKEIEDILKYDPGLTANILKLTNSAYFGIPSRVSSVRQAIILIGWKRLMQLVMTMCMSRLMQGPVAGYDLPRGELWRHSVAVSVGAGLLVASLGMHDADEAVTAALLHDIGKIVLGSFVQKDMGEIEAVVAKGISFEVAEYIVLGINHAAIGARILQKWSLPDGLVNAVGRHHDPDSCSGSCRLSDVVHVANVVSRRAGFGKGLEGQVPEPSTDVMGRLGIQSSHIDQLAEQTRQEVGKLTDILN